MFICKLLAAVLSTVWVAGMMASPASASGEPNGITAPCANCWLSPQELTGNGPVI